jgi:hypothetical protein
VKVFYAILAAAGAAIPFSQFLPWAAEHGLDARSFVLELFSTRIGAFFGLDVLISAIVLLAFIFREGSRANMTKLWMPAAATVLIGVSCGLPLFLYMRESSMTKRKES